MKISVVPESFSLIQVNVVGPLPTISEGNEYIVILVDLAICCFHGVAVKKISSTFLGNALQNTNRFCFVFYLYFLEKKTVSKLNILHSVSSPHHPERQGALKRSHHTLKAPLAKHRIKNSLQWDENLRFILFCLHDMPCASNGFSSFDLMLSHRVLGLLTLVRDRLLQGVVVNMQVLDLVDGLGQRQFAFLKTASEYLSHSQKRTEWVGGLKAKTRVFTPRR